MALIVQKFGGTSVSSTERIRNVALRVAKWRRAGHDIVVVPSAMAGETNRLLALAAQIQAHPEPRELDVVAATGEQVTAGLVAMALVENGVPARSYAGWQVKVLTDRAHTKARIISIDDARIRRDLAQGRVVVVAGFQGVDDEGNVTTLGRVPDLHRRRRRLHHRSAHRAECAASADRDFRGNAGTGERRLQGAADPLGRVRRQVQGADARALQPH
jgi:aspartate kinase